MTSENRAMERTGVKASHAFALAVVLGVGLVAAREAHADRRIFGFTYPYMTLPKGGFEIEHYLDASFAETDDPDRADVVETDLMPSASASRGTGSSTRPSTASSSTAATA